MLPCRGLFERHKLLLSLQMAARIAASLGTLAQDQWKVLLEGTRSLAETTPSSVNPAATWLSERAWQDLAGLSTMPAFEVQLPLLLHTTHQACRAYPLKIPCPAILT